MGTSAQPEGDSPIATFRYLPVSYAKNRNQRYPGYFLHGTAFTPSLH
jgi:hypothetical protein